MFMHARLFKHMNMCEGDISVNFIHLNKLIGNQRILCTNATMFLNRQFPKITQYYFMVETLIDPKAGRTSS